MIVIPAGKFRMGDIQGRGLKVEQPVHVVHDSEVPMRSAGMKSL